MHCAKPDNSLFSWRGFIVCRKLSTDVSMSNLALKGSILMHNEWVIGLVVFVGPNTKFIVPKPRVKKGIADQNFTRSIWCLVPLILIGSMIVAICRIVFLIRNQDLFTYITQIEK
jgi:magnesium-transporting ATPase (P-type)